ncbi:hypothetical protein DPEC_G00377180 [Dallia pectoralis]|nr:hypothetical protein DPEC_G00377180 [Dallia pectoralis]
MCHCCGRQYCRTSQHPLLDHSTCHDEALWMAYIHRGTCREGPTPFLFTQRRAAITSSTLSILLLGCRRWSSFKDALTQLVGTAAVTQFAFAQAVKKWLRYDPRPGRRVCKTKYSYARRTVYL